ncbi:MAG: [FeFe] hydrogenase H-cluster maturation GTPase HydF [Kiritimatiellae bacterium]|nr:[FeFe] hydrogenase H-cluster maturation GTPase HydF [Kiritimatiellia bacterium]
MSGVPTGLRLQIGVFGRANVGKSSLVNWIAGQPVSIVSPLPGTTTDVVAKPIELLPLGPVTLLDTGGLDDRSELGALRIERARKVLDRAEVVLLVVESEVWTGFEEEVVAESRARALPVVAVVNKSDVRAPSAAFVAELRRRCAAVVVLSAVRTEDRDERLEELKRAIERALPPERTRTPPLLGDLVPPGGLAVLVVPIDLQAPKGRLILPQVQALRDLLDHDAAGLVVKEREYAALLRRLASAPDLVVCDSQVVMKVVADTPPEVRCTTFSILFTRLKGDLAAAVRGVRAVDRLKDGDRVLIAEACSHHALEDDIGRVKIPRWLRQYTGRDLRIEVVAGRDYPQDLGGVRLIIHCGACMLTRREMLNRLDRAVRERIAITNYGVCIAHLHGVLERVLSPFPELRADYAAAAGGE